MNFLSATSVTEDLDIPRQNGLAETNFGAFPEDTQTTDWVLNHLYGEHAWPEEVGSIFSAYWKNEVEDFAPHRDYCQVNQLSGGLLTFYSELMPRWIYWQLPGDSTRPNVDTSNFRGRLIPARSDAVTFLEEDVSSYLEELLLFQINTEELFLDGIDSSLSRDVISAVEAFGNAAVKAVEKITDSGSANVEVVGELLRQMGYVEDIWSHQARREVLARKLESSDPRIRDAASVGIAALDDPSVLEHITRAFARETSTLVKQNLKLVMDQLQETKCHDS